MLSKHEWIATDRQFFGKPNTAYDFGTNMTDVSSRLARMQEQKVVCCGSARCVCVFMLVCGLG